MKEMLLVLGFLAGAVLPLQGQRAEDIVKAVRARLDKVQDYEASGKMKIDASFIKAPPAAITAYYKKPDRFRIKRSGGISILPKGGVSISINSLLFTENYATVDAGTAPLKGVTTRVIKLLPLDEGTDIVLTTLYIDEGAKLIRKAAITTRESGSYEMDLDYGRFSSWGLPDKVVFSFNTKNYKLPKGISVEYEKGNQPRQQPKKDAKGRVEISYSSYSINKGVDDAVFKE